ncbi:hypothetical protein CPC08DRAFT_730786 [Agrocybe pediades]|nr:hypothetical protein CPC08DRAFT_730786 [Agrocybe pediades]
MTESSDDKAFNIVRSHFKLRLKYQPIARRVMHWVGSASGLSNSTVVDKSLNCSEESKLCLTYITACLDRQLRALLKWPHHALIKPMWSKAVVISQLMSCPRLQCYSPTINRHMMIPAGFRAV